MNKLSDPITDQDQHLSRIREYIAGGIALLVVGGTAGMVIAAFSYVNNKDTFAEVKDLLFFVNPLVGVVVGYYFTRTTTEGRAESAERAAKEANSTAEQATKTLGAVQNDLNMTRQITTNLVAKANQIAKYEKGYGTLGGATSTPSKLVEEKALLELQIALDQANDLLGIT